MPPSKYNDDSTPRGFSDVIWPKRFWLHNLDFLKGSQKKQIFLCRNKACFLEHLLELACGKREPKKHFTHGSRHTGSTLFKRSTEQTHFNYMLQSQCISRKFQFQNQHIKVKDNTADHWTVQWLLLHLKNKNSSMKMCFVEKAKCKLQRKKKKKRPFQVRLQSSLKAPSLNKYSSTRLR